MVTKVTNRMIEGADFAMLSVIADLDLSPTADNRQEIQDAMQLCVDNNWKLIVDKEVFVNTDYELEVTVNYTLRGALWVPNGLRCEFSAGASINSLPNAADSARILVFKNRENIRMYYPKVIGDRIGHTGGTGEGGHGYELGGAIGNIYLHEPKALQTWGDGYYIGPYWADPSTSIPDDITLYQPYSFKASRNGISFTGGTNIRIIRPVNEDVDRIAPMAGIDIEPEHQSIADMPVQCVIENPTSRRCGGHGLFTFLNKGVIDIEILGTVFDEDSLTTWTHKVYLPNDALRGRLHIEGLYGKNNLNEGYLVENLEDYVTVNVNTVDIVSCWRGTDGSGRYSAGIFETSFGSRGRADVDPVFSDVRFGSLNVYDYDVIHKVLKPLTLIRKHAQVTYMKDVNVSININETFDEYIQAEYGIDKTCFFKCEANFTTAVSSGVLASKRIFTGLVANGTVDLNHQSLTNKAGCVIEKRSSGTEILTLRPPQDGSVLYDEDNTKTSVSTAWIFGRAEFSPLAATGFTYGIVAKYGFN